MTETLSELTTQLEKLRKARASGVLTVQYVGNGVSRSLAHKSDREMQSAIQDLERRIAAMQGGGKRTIRVSASKGLGHEN